MFAWAAVWSVPEILVALNVSVDGLNVKAESLPRVESLVPSYCSVINGILLGIKSIVLKQLVKDFFDWCKSNKIWFF